MFFGYRASMKKSVAVLMTFFLTVVASLSAYAGVSVTQQLDLGEWVVRDNDVVYDITLQEDGSYTYDSDGFTMISAPQEGIYEIDGFTPGASVVSVSVVQVSALSSAGKSFAMPTFYESHDATVDGGGAVTVNIGVVINTSGDGTSYPFDSIFNGTIGITVNF